MCEKKKAQNKLMSKNKNRKNEKESDSLHTE